MGEIVLDSAGGSVRGRRRGQEVSAEERGASIFGEGRRRTSIGGRARLSESAKRCTSSAKVPAPLKCQDGHALTQTDNSSGEPGLNSQSTAGLV